MARTAPGPCDPSCTQASWGHRAVTKPSEAPESQSEEPEGKGAPAPPEISRGALASPRVPPNL